MNKVFLIVVCISPSLLHSMENKQTPKMPPSRSMSVPSDAYTCSPLIIDKMPGRSRLDSNPQKPNPNLIRTRSQSRETPRFVQEENAMKIYPLDSEGKK